MPPPPLLVDAVARPDDLLSRPYTYAAHAGLGGFPCDRCFRLAVPCRIQHPKDQLQPGEEPGAALVRAVVDRCNPAGACIWNGWKGPPGWTGTDDDPTDRRLLWALRSVSPPPPHTP